MSSFFRKSFGGLSAEYYFRQFFFGFLLLLLFYYSYHDNPHPLPLKAHLLIVASTLLYPYSRFVYEGIVGFVLGDNFFFVNAWLMLMVKFVTMFCCWLFALFIAPVGLLYLFVRNSRRDPPEG